MWGGGGGRGDLKVQAHSTISEKDERTIKVDCM